MNNVLHIAIEQIAKISVLLNPIIPLATGKVFKILNYDVEKIADLVSITLQRELLKGKQVTEKILKLVPELRKVYNSSYLTCLHDNSIFKQKNPVINLVRQLLKCNYLLIDKLRRTV